MSTGLVFTAEMRDVAAAMKGKTFKSYECALESAGNGGYANGNVRINLGQYAIELTCYNSLFDLDGETVEMTSLACKKVELDEPFRPYVVKPSHAYMVNERITGIDLVSDHVDVKGSQENYSLDIDVAIAIRTNKTVYTFAREIWFSSGMDITVSDGIVVPYTTEKCTADWSDDDPEEGDAVAEITRTTIRLA